MIEILNEPVTLVAVFYAIVEVSKYIKNGKSSSLTEEQEKKLDKIIEKLDEIEDRFKTNNMVDTIIKQLNKE